MSKSNSNGIKIVIVKLPIDSNRSCQLTHFSTEFHDRKGGKILVDYPAGFDYRERVWIPENENVFPV